MGDTSLNSEWVYARERDWLENEVGQNISSKTGVYNNSNNNHLYWHADWCVGKDFSSIIAKTFSLSLDTLRNYIEK